MRVLGVDPGLSRCGLGLVDGPAARARAVRLEVVRTPADTSVGDRLAELADAVDAVLADGGVEVLAVERTFFGANVQTAMAVGQAAGVVLLAAARRGLTVAQYTPTQVKAAVAGHGGAGKVEVAAMVRALLGLSAPPQPADAADALALALCHLHHTQTPAARGMSSRLAAAVDEAAPGAQVVQPGAGGLPRGRGRGKR